MLKRQKSRRSRAGDLITKYLKLKTAGKATKGAGRAAKWTAYGKAAKGTAERTPKKVWVPIVGTIGAAAAALTAWKARSGDPSAPPAA